MLYSANNALLKINDVEILASNAQMSLNAALEANYVIGDRNTNSYVASNGIGGTLNFSYFQVIYSYQFLEHNKTHFDKSMN